ncbi:MAG: ATP-binding protein, partial [Anaerolineales bacterium]
MGKVIKEYHQIFKGEYANLNTMREFVARAAQEAGLSSSAIYGIELAVDEACSNIIDHAYGGESRGEIECNALIREDGLEIILKDKGKPFDPNKIPEPDIQ